MFQLTTDLDDGALEFLVIIVTCDFAHSLVLRERIQRIAERLLISLQFEFFTLFELELGGRFIYLDAVVWANVLLLIGSMTEGRDGPLAASLIVPPASLASALKHAVIAVFLILLLHCNIALSEPADERLGSRTDWLELGDVGGLLLALQAAVVLRRLALACQRSVRNRLPPIINHDIAIGITVSLCLIGLLLG